MKTRLVVVGAMLVTLIIVAWYYLASKAYKDYVEEFRSLSSELEKQRSTFLESDRVRSEVRLEDLSEYVRLYGKLREEMIHIQSGLKNGTGMWFWLPDAREQSADTMLAFMNSEDTTRANAERAMEDVSGVYSEVSQFLSRGSAERSKAISLLNPHSDSEDFRAELEEVSKVSIELSGLRAQVDSLMKRPSFGGMSEALRIGLLSYLEHRAKDESTAFGIREKALLAADKQLTTHKSRVSQVVSSQSGMLTSMNSLAGELRPAVTLTYEKVQPVRNMIDELEKPLFRENIAGGLGSLFGASFGAPLSAMSLISSVDPSTGQIISLIRDICDGISSAHSEINGVIEATQPLLDASQQFQNSQSRSSMLRVIESAARVSSYYESKRSIFDPITSKLDGAQNGINRINAAASQVRIPGARNLILRLAGGAHEIISIAYGPFNQWQQTVTTTAQSMQQLDVWEKEYIATLIQLRSDRVSDTQNERLEETSSIGQSSDSSSTGPEREIKELLVDSKEIATEDNLSFDYVDLNNDGIKEIIARDGTVSGNGWGLHFVFLVDPLRMVLKMDGYVAYEVLTSSTLGYYEIKGMVREGSTVFRWNGTHYESN